MLKISVTKPLKPAIRKCSEDKETTVVNTTSGQFIAEPITKRNPKKARLTFSDCIVESG